MGASHLGGCLCGAVRYSIDEPIFRCVHCHCDSCRKNCGAPMTTYVGVHGGAWRWVGGPAAIYISSPGVKRFFCATCGSPVAFVSEQLANKMHFYAAALDDPEAFVPTGHFFKHNKLSWLHLADELPDVTNG